MMLRTVTSSWTCTTHHGQPANSLLTAFVTFTIGLLPGAVYMMYFWHTRKELALKNDLFFGAATVSSALASSWPHAIEQLNGALGLHDWQWIFLVDSIPVLLLILAVYFLMPYFPAVATFSDQRREGARDGNTQS